MARVVDLGLDHDFRAHFLYRFGAYVLDVGVVADHFLDECGYEERVVADDWHDGVHERDRVVFHVHVGWCRVFPVPADYAAVVVLPDCCVLCLLRLQIEVDYVGVQFRGLGVLHAGVSRARWVGVRRLTYPASYVVVERYFHCDGYNRYDHLGDRHVRHFGDDGSDRVGSVVSPDDFRYEMRVAL